MCRDATCRVSTKVVTFANYLIRTVLRAKADAIVKTAVADDLVVSAGATPLVVAFVQQSKLRPF